MSYVRQRPLGLDAAQKKGLLSVSDEELQSLTAAERLEFGLRFKQIESQRVSNQWSAIASFVSVALPVAAFLGISWSKKRKR